MPTTNPVPSQDPSDLLFNSGKLDEVLNGTGTSFTDRLGTARRTVAGMNADFDAQLADAESDLNVYRADAAASAAQALGYLNTIRTTSYGAYASDPATDPLGNPPTVGDEYFNTTSNLLKRWNGATWQASDINTANLAAPSGSSLVGYGTGTVQDVLDAVTGPNGAASVGYTPAGTGAVATTVQSKLRENVSVLDFYANGVSGAKVDPTGVIDSTAGIQAAIDASTSVYIPIGTYKVTSTIYLRRGLHLFGAGMHGAVIDGSTMTAQVFATQLNRHGSASADQGLRDATLEQFKIVGNTASTTNDLIRLVHGFHRAKISRVWFYSCGGNALHIDADTGYGGYYDTIEQCVFGNPSDFSSGSDTSLIKGYGIYAIGSCNQVTVRENVFWRIKKDAINLNGSATWSLQRWSIVDNGIEYSGYFEGATPYYGVRINEHVTNVAVERNYIEYNGFNPGLGYLGGGVFCDSTKCTLSISDNQFSNHPYNIRLANVNSAAIEGNAWLTDCTYFDIKIDSVIGKFVFIGENNDIATARNGKFLSVPVALQPKVYGDTTSARLRGTSCLVGSFTPKLYGGATEISCSSASGFFERQGERLRVNFSFTVSNLNGATGLIGIAGSDGINLPLPGLSTSIQYPFKNDTALSASFGKLYLSNVTLTADYEEVHIAANQNGTYYAYLREQGSGKSNQNLNATALAVGSVLRGEFIVYV